MVDLSFPINTCYFFVRLVVFQFFSSLLFTTMMLSPSKANGDAVAAVADAAAAVADVVAVADASPLKEQAPVDASMTNKRGSPTPSEEGAPDSKKAATSPLKEEEDDDKATTDATPKSEEAFTTEDKTDVTEGTPEADNDKPCVITPVTTNAKTDEWPTDETKAIIDDRDDKADLVDNDEETVKACVEESVENVTTVEATTSQPLEAQ
jgi:hypothetical protein